MGGECNFSPYTKRERERGRDSTAARRHGEEGKPKSSSVVVIQSLIIASGGWFSVEASRRIQSGRNSESFTEKNVPVPGPHRLRERTEQ